jgi:hypothetical protein
MVEIYWPLIALGLDLLLSVVSMHALSALASLAGADGLLPEGGRPGDTKGDVPQHHRPNQQLTIDYLQSAMCDRP